MSLGVPEAMVLVTEDALSAAAAEASMKMFSIVDKMVEVPGQNVPE